MFFSQIQIDVHSSQVRTCRHRLSRGFLPQYPVLPVLIRQRQINKAKVYLELLDIFRLKASISVQQFGSTKSTSG